MRRLLLVFLLLVLPCQMSWAAAARYCQHEAATSANWHIGHHEHRHEAKSEHDKKPVIDIDCGVCHLASLPLACAALSVESAVARVHAPARSVEPNFRSRHTGAPDRPQWRRLV
ncbi:MAG: cobalt-zinc-cadmium resistance protein [Cupriavidus sp.]|nr:MAG: cobalt-zinc-cadmium resistance protein [Cupriavidus sp.]